MTSRDAQDLVRPDSVTTMPSPVGVGDRGRPGAGRVLLAPDKFKGSASARQVARSLARGISRSWPDAQVIEHAMADGGDGTVEVLLAHGFRPVQARVRGPLGPKVTAMYAVRNEHAVIEAASACGLALLAQGPTSSTARNCTSFGVGELIAHARSEGARRITVAVGGTACTDGGAGALQALGADIRGSDSRSLPPGGEALTRVVVVDVAPVRELLAGIDLVVACDVTNPLLGPTGSASFYAAQKGASSMDVALLQKGLIRWAEAVTTGTGRRIHDLPGTGAAGGLAFGLAAVDAHIVSGLETMLDLTGFARRLTGVDLVVVAEGSLDEQSLFGKGPIGIARTADSVNVPTVAVAGRCTLTAAQVRASGLRAVHTLAELEPDLEASMRDVETLLEQVGASVAAAHLMPRLR